MFTKFYSENVQKHFEENIKKGMKQIGRGLHLSDSGQRPVADCCEHSTKLSCLSPTIFTRTVLHEVRSMLHEHCCLTFKL